MIFGSLRPHTPNFNVDSEFLMALRPVTFVEITSQNSEQSAANIEIGGMGAAWPMLSHSNGGAQKNGLVTILFLCEVISVNCSKLRSYFHRSDLGDCAYKRQRALVQVRSVGKGGGESWATTKWFAIYFSHPWTPFST